MNSSQRNQFKPNLTFSQRYGYESLPNAMKSEHLSPEFRIALSNYAFTIIKQQARDDFTQDSFSVAGAEFLQRVFGKYEKKSESQISKSIQPRNLSHYSQVIAAVDEIIQKAKFYHVLNFLEFLIESVADPQVVGKKFASLFESHGASYRLDLSHEPYYFLPIASQEQGEAILQSIQTLKDQNRDSVYSHLRNAAKYINEQNYHGSIAESILAVEDISLKIDPSAKTLSQVNLHKVIDIHPALGGSIKKLYGYASDIPGVRHAGPSQRKLTGKVTEDEALVMYGACASFAAYLSKMQLRSKRARLNNL